MDPRLHVPSLALLLVLSVLSWRYIITHSVEPEYGTVLSLGNGQTLKWSDLLLLYHAIPLSLFETNILWGSFVPGWCTSLLPRVGVGMPL